MSEEKKEINIDSTNIFDEFGVDEKLKKEINSVEKEKNKNIWYYIFIISNFFIYINMIILLIFILLGWYIYIQNDKSIENISYLNPVCDIFVDDLWKNENCSSVSSLILGYEKDNEIIKNKYYKQNLPLIKIIYKNINFINSKEVSFLISKTKEKLRVLEILSEFDKLKNTFSPLNKTLIKCEDLNISSNFVIDMQCSAYSWVWDSEILWYSWKNNWQDKVKWTSISVVSSFINFIEKVENPKFLILEKPKKFSFVEIINNNGYTRKTDFKLKLKYNNILLQNK